MSRKFLVYEVKKKRGIDTGCGSRVNCSPRAYLEREDRGCSGDAYFGMRARYMFD